ncbi:hypothetical protein [Rhizobium johnstonii]|uniref:hypothetical protein n=1 Tax=Rhizobium johnstonii TaxID=3019933 RepID=UPI003F98EE5A
MGAIGAEKAVTEFDLGCRQQGLEAYFDDGARGLAAVLARGAGGFFGLSDDVFGSRCETARLDDDKAGIGGLDADDTEAAAIRHAAELRKHLIDDRVQSCTDADAIQRRHEVAVERAQEAVLNGFESFREAIGQLSLQARVNSSNVLGV